MKFTEEHKRNIKKAKEKIKGKTYEQIYGKKKSMEIREKLSISQMGRISPNKGKPAWSRGLTKETDLRIRKISEKLKGTIIPDSVKEKLSKIHKGKHYSSRTEFKKGHKTWITGVGHSDETKKKISLIHKGKKISQETRRKMSLSRRGKVNLKEKNGSWKGGIAFEPYTPEFNQRFKNVVRKRDNQLCMSCGIHREKLKRALDIHHINYDKKMSVPENCISLCRSCHSLTQFHREYWQKLFQDKLKRLYSYEYESDGCIIVKIGGGR